MPEYKHVHADCPECKTHFLAPVNVEELTANIKPKVETKEVWKYPGYMPGYGCKAGNCEYNGVHPNDNYHSKPSKKCDNCDQFATDGMKKCPWCKGEDFSEIDDDELKGLGIPLPAIQEMHNH